MIVKIARQSERRAAFRLRLHHGEQLLDQNQVFSLSRRALARRVLIIFSFFHCSRCVFVLICFLRSFILTQVKNTMANKRIYTATSIAIGVVAFAFDMVGICTNEWRTGGTQGYNNLGLWMKCDSSSCSEVQIGQSRAFFAFEIVRGFGVLAVIAVFAGIAFAVASAAIKKLNIGHTVLATLFLMSAFFGIIAASVFTSLSHSTTTNWGYSFALTWTAAPLALTAGILNIIPELEKD